MPKGPKKAGQVQNAKQTEIVMAGIAKLYEMADKKAGLYDMAKRCDLTIVKPRSKVSVMLIGNHSAGKSTFINWYIGESVQNTGVAIETKGFTFVTKGNKSQVRSGVGDGGWGDGYGE